MGNSSLLIDWIRGGEVSMSGCYQQKENGRLRPLLQSAFSEQWGVISPNGLWLAYASDETGSSEVYVQSFPELGKRVQISEMGGFQPAWSRSGRELFYRTGEKMMVVPVETEKNFKA